MQATDQLNRQGRGCGYEPPAPAGMRPVPWQPPRGNLGYRHSLPVLCAGYTTRLPEVQEIARAHAHWSKGQLAAFLGGEQPTEELLAFLEILDCEISNVKAYAVTPVSEGGGREERT